METARSVIRRAMRIVGAGSRLGACAAAAGLAVGGPALGASVLSVDFESYALGPLGAPWSVSFNTGPDGASTASIATSPGHGKVLVLNGKSSPANLIASLPLSSSAPDITVAFEVRPASGASFVWGFHGAGRSLGSRRIRLQRAPSSPPTSPTLAAQTVPSGTTICGGLASGAWSKVVLTVHTQLFPHTFDVSINNAPTACNGTLANLSPPFTQVSVMDASNEGWGGKVSFDNISVTTP
jgi:hypothetical protein